MSYKTQNSSLSGTKFSSLRDSQKSLYMLLSSPLNFFLPTILHRLRNNSTFFKSMRTLAH